MSKIAVKDENQVAEDKRLMVIMQTGTKRDAELALTKIRTRYKDPMFYKAYQFFNGDKVVAEDMVQEIFMKVWERKHQYNANLSVFSTWLYNIAKNNMTDEKRKNNIEVLSINNLNMENKDVEIAGEVGFQLKSTTLSPIEILVKSERSKALSIAIDKVFIGKTGERNKQVLTLYYFAELDLDEVSKQTQINVATVKIILMRAKEKLKAYLSKGNRLPV